MQINDPGIVAELTECHLTYEAALVANDVDRLNRLFWDAPQAVRYGVAENLYGGEQIRNFRQTRPVFDLARQITRLEITALGEETGIVNLEFSRSMKGTERLGRQTQFWRKFSEGWKIVSAHISLLPEPASFVRAAADRIGLPIAPAYLGEVSADLERTAAVASFLMEFPLDQSIEAAPVFQP